jgi:hypothetical protein
MSIKKILSLGFIFYIIFTPIICSRFILNNISASIAILGIAFTLCILIITGRLLFINLIISIYVTQNYLIRPYISFFESKMSTNNQAYIEEINNYFNSNAASVVYWNLFFILFSWLMGILITTPSINLKIKKIPTLFFKIDHIINPKNFSFWVIFIMFTILNYQSPENGLRSSFTGEGDGSFLWGMTSLSTISFTSLFIFLNNNDNISQKNYLLLLPILISAFISMLSGSRGGLVQFLIAGLFFWTYKNFKKKINLSKLFKLLLYSFFSVLFVVFTGILVQSLKPLYRYSENVDFSTIINTISLESFADNSDFIYFGITELLYRISALKAQFLILNDMQLHNTWEYINPLMIFQRTINDLFPGDVFKNLLSINQLFDYVYKDSFVYYNSEMWSLQGTLYLYFGLYFGPLVIFFLAIFFTMIYNSLHFYFIKSSAFSAFVMLLLLDLLTNGTFERIFVVDIVRPLLNFIIFIFSINVLKWFFKLIKINLS